ncbi:hypothetical protein [Vibrio europaeus]|uniref:hypothetical protein n=1 Tax=Vibrio europaeus TaxID=300876 RepID=UPI00233EF4FF|nr:hypothetical protein [Vibrio europaeus]MDC5855187.1 hypothetical protein [Vibrio europaeus]
MKNMLFIFLAIIPMLGAASQPTGKISSLTFYGSGASEVIFVTIEPKISACPYKGRYVMHTKERPAITSALIAAFHAQITIEIVGTGKCDHIWSNDEVMDYAKFTK